MDINRMMTELDKLYDENRKDEIEGFLVANFAFAATEGAKDAMLTLYNEMIGYYRETGRYEEAVDNSKKAIALMDDMGLQGTVAYATTLLNVANAHRAAGLLEDALGYYTRIFPIYSKHLEPDDMYYAGLYNNLSLLYQELGDFKNAKEQLENALRIVIKNENTQFEVAVTQANLANTCIELGEDEEAKARAEEAIRIFDEIGVDDAHYSAALSALGSLYYIDKDYKKALEVMKKSRACVEKYLGNGNVQYQRLTENIEIIEKKLEEQMAEENLQKMIEENLEDNVKEFFEDTKTVDDVIEEYLQNDEEQTSEGIDINTEYDDVNIDFDNFDLEKENVHDAEDNIFEDIIDDIVAEQEPVNEDNAEVSEETGEEDNAEISEEIIEEDNAEVSEEIIEEDNAEILEEIIEDDNAKNAEAVNDEVINIPTEELITDISVALVKGASDFEKDISEKFKPDESLVVEEKMTGMSICRQYYEEFGKNMISSEFADYESKIAVGLVGKGSDCFGFDDVQSRDHDFGPRFVMWVTRETYDEIGDRLQKAYEQLPDEYMGIKRIETFHGRDRSGVMVIEDFYKNTIGNDLINILKKNEFRESVDSIKAWLAAPEYGIAAAVNGEVFRDDEGIFTAYRNRLKEYYPKTVLYRRLAQTCASFSQNGQYNLDRMRKRGQLVSAELAKAECMKHAMKLMYLLNGQYPPHDKWLFKGMPLGTDMLLRSEDIANNADEDKRRLSDNLIYDTEVPELLNRMCLLSVAKENEQELSKIIETLAVIFANELEKKNILGISNVYLDANTDELVVKSDALLSTVASGKGTVEGLSLLIAKAEFKAFDVVQNEGGRASCQNNWPTFKVMRMSQYMTWDEDMLLQYYYEFSNNLKSGRNMIQEKYARMMQSTAPEKYAEFEMTLPEISEEKQTIIEEIVKLQVIWMENFAKEYPNLADNARMIHTSDDGAYNTSYETYLRGELGTYSDRMLEMYGRYIVNYVKNGKSVAYDIMENTVHFYGYENIETANEKS